MDVDDPLQGAADRGGYVRLPLGIVAYGHGFRRTGLTRRDLVREYDEWIEPSFGRPRDPNDHEPR
jgi:hypothetical protein